MMTKLLRCSKVQLQLQPTKELSVHNVLGVRLGTKWPPQTWLRATGRNLWPSDWFLVNICWLGMLWWIHYTWSKRTGFLEAGSLPSLPVDNFWTNMIFMQYSWIFNRTVSRALSVSFCFQVSRTVSHSSQVVYSESWWSHGEAPKVSKGLKRVWIKFWRSWRSWNTFAKHQAKHLFAAEVLINFWNRIWKSSQKISSNTPSRGCDWPLKQPAPKILKPTKDNTALWDLLTKSALILDGVDDARALMEYRHRRATAVTVVRCMSSAAFKGPPGPPSPALRSRSPIPCGPSRFVNQRNQRNPYDHGRAVRQLHRCAQQESAMADGPGQRSTGRGPATESRNGEVPDFFRLVLRCFKPWPWHSGWCLFLWTFSAILKACQEQYLFLKTGVSKN